MYQAYIPGRGPYPALFPIPLAHPAPLRPGEHFFPGAPHPGLQIAPTSIHNGAPILSIPSVAAFRARIEKDNAECLNLVKRNSSDVDIPRSGHGGGVVAGQVSSALKPQSKFGEPLQAGNRHAVGPAEFTRFTIDDILGKSEDEAQPKEIAAASDEELSAEEIEVVRDSTPQSAGSPGGGGGGGGGGMRRGLPGDEDEETEPLVFGAANEPDGGITGDDPTARFSWLQCTRYKPPKLPRIKKKDGVKKRKLGRNPRVPFTQHQVATLEQKFQRTHYLSSVDVAELSAALNLTETRVKIWFQNRRARERRERESNIQPSGAQRSLGQQPPASSRQDAQQLASELCAQRLGQGAPIHPMSPAEAAAAAALGPSAMGPMGINWPPLAIPPNPALIAHISHSLGSSSAFRPVSFPT